MMHLYKGFYPVDSTGIITIGVPNPSTNIFNTYQNNSFNEWLAGVIDGDGHFRLSHGKYPFLQIIMEVKNTPLLAAIQARFGGYLVSPVNCRPTTAKYTLGKRHLMRELVNSMNGHIRGINRVPQFIELCNNLDIKYIPAIPLTRDSAWFSGMIDSDGTIVAGITKKYPTISIKATSMHYADLEVFTIFGGSINKGGPNCYDWVISHPDKVTSMVEYFNEYPLFSHKMLRVQRIEEFYMLRSLKANRKDSRYHDAWKNWIDRWKLS